jgi:D-sedoheptulose 7-phosphate isomerase
MTPDSILEKNLLASIVAKQELLANTNQLKHFNNAVDLVIQRYRIGGRLYIAGNGGSAADAQHLAAEFVSKLGRERGPLAAEALTVDSSVLTAIGNDYGYDEVFARQIVGKMTTNDVFLGITTSGRSPNILRALTICRELNIPSIVFTGHDGGLSIKIADHCLIAPGKTTATIQEVHILFAHSLCECVELAIFTNDK